MLKAIPCELMVIKNSCKLKFLFQSHHKTTQETSNIANSPLGNYNNVWWNLFKFCFALEIKCWDIQEMISVHFLHLQFAAEFCLFHHLSNQCNQASSLQFRAICIVWGSSASCKIEIVLCHWMHHTIQQCKLFGNCCEVAGCNYIVIPLDKHCVLKVTKCQHWMILHLEHLLKIV